MVSGHGQALAIGQPKIVPVPGNGAVVELGHGPPPTFVSKNLIPHYYVPYGRKPLPGLYLRPSGEALVEWMGRRRHPSHWIHTRAKAIVIHSLKNITFVRRLVGG